MSLAWSAGQVLTAADMNARNPIYAQKTATQSIASSTTFTDDTELFVDLLPNRVYDVRLMLTVTGDAAADIKLGWTAATDLTLTVKRHARGPTIGTTDVTGGSAAATTVGVNRSSGAHAVGTTNSYGLDGTNASSIEEDLVVTTGSVGGRLRLQWAQRTSNAAATVVGVDSYLVAVPVA